MSTDNTLKYMSYREDNIVVIGLPKSTVEKMLQSYESANAQAILVEGAAFAMPGLLMAIFVADNPDVMLKSISQLTGRPEEELEQSAVEVDSDLHKALANVGLTPEDLVK